MSRSLFRLTTGVAVMALAASILVGEAKAQVKITLFAADRDEEKKEPEPLPAPKQLPPSISGPVPPASGLGLPDLIRMTVERNPRLAQAAFAIDAAAGRAVQAGLCPNPTMMYTADELYDRTGRAGIHTPLVSQEIVTAGKLKLSRAAALREVDQASLALVAERYGRFAAVRQSYFEVLTLQRRIDILRQLVKLAEQSVETTKKLLEAKQAARLDLVQLEVELERFRADLEATEREIPAAFRRLAASVGVQNLPPTPVLGSLEIAFPEYDLETARAFLVDAHPDVRSAKVGVDRARLLLQRAQVEPIPNVTAGIGYTYQGQNRSNDFSIAVGFPIPVWNKNQGNIAAAQAQVGEAVQQVGRVENELVGQLAEAFRAYAAARQRAERYRTAIIPKAQETYELSLKAYQGGQFEYLRVLTAQQAVAQANLEYNRSLGEVWRAASELSGLLLEEQWPSAPGAPSAPAVPCGPQHKQP